MPPPTNGRIAVSLPTSRPQKQPLHEKIQVCIESLFEGNGTFEPPPAEWSRLSFGHRCLCRDIEDITDAVLLKFERDMQRELQLDASTEPAMLEACVAYPLKLVDSLVMVEICRVVQADARYSGCAGKMAIWMGKARSGYAEWTKSVAYFGWVERQRVLLGKQIREGRRLSVFAKNLLVRLRDVKDL